MQSIEKQRVTAVTGHIFFIILGTISLLFYKERMLYYDPAYFSFWIINDVDVSIALGRWGAVFSQILPLWAVKNHFSIETILQLFSVSFIMVYYIIFLVLIYGFKDVKATLVLLLSLCLTFRITFYYPTAELYHGIALSILFWATLKKITNWSGKLYWVGIVLSLGLIVFLSYFHQMTIFLVLFFLAIEWFSDTPPKDKKLLIIGMLGLVWFLIRIKFLTVSEYEKEKLLGPAEFMSQIPHLGSNPTFGKYLSFFAKDALIPVIAFLLSLLLLLKHNIKLALVSIGTFVGFSLLVIITLYRGESIIMTENYLTVLGVFMAVPIVFVTWDFRKFFMFSILFILTGYSLVKIYNAGNPLTKRIATLENMIQYANQFPNKKYIVRENNHKDDYYWSSWSMPFETLLLSALNKNYENVTFFIQKESLKLTTDELSQDNIFLGPEWSPLWLKTNNFNKQYFNLPGGQYLLLSTSQDSSTFNESLFNNHNFQLESLRRLNYGDDGVVIKLSNNSEQILSSIPGERIKVQIGYHLLDEHNNLISWDNTRTLIDLDIHPEKSLLQELKINHPGKPGKYILQLDMVTEGVRWWNINSLTEIIFN